MSESANRFTSSGSSIARTPCWSRSGAEGVERAPHRLGAGELTGVRRRQQPGVLGDDERLGVRLGRSDGLVVGEPERHDAAPGPGGGDPRLVDRDRGLDRPVGGHHQADADPELLGRRGGGVEHHVDDVLVGAEPVAVVGRVERRLHPDRAVEHAVLDHLVDEPGEVLRGLEHLAGGHVGVGEGGEGPVPPDRGNRDPGGVGQLGEGGRAHRALEVEVQVTPSRRAAEVPWAWNAACGASSRTVAAGWALRGSRNAAFTRESTARKSGHP